MVLLSKANFVEAKHGKGGGYKLSRKPEDYTLLDILMLTETSLCTVACLEQDAIPCPRAEICPTQSVWKGLDAVIHDYLKSITLASLLPQNSSDNTSNNFNYII